MCLLLCLAEVNSDMKIESHSIDGITIAEVISADIVIATLEDGLDLLGNLYYQGFDKVILHERNITADFFNLKTGIAGEILQKFSTYRVKLAIVGDFSVYDSKPLKDFIHESNRGGHTTFVRTVAEALILT